jgi:predicted transcriptional regulator
MRKVEDIQWAAPAESVLGILNRMRERDINQMPVLEEGHIVGIVARDSILRVLQTRIQVGDHLAVSDRKTS